MKNVVSYNSSHGVEISLCKKCIKVLEGSGKWPRDWAGEEICQVSHGLHSGYCDRCEETEIYKTVSR